MKVHVTKDKPFNPLRGKSLRFKYLLIGSFTFFGLIVVVVTSMYYGMVLYQSGKAGSINYVAHDFMVTKFGFIGNWMAGLTASPPEFKIDLDFEDLQKLRYYRDLSLEEGFVSEVGKDDDVSANLTYNGEQYKVKISLTGFTLRHVADPERWSFRIKIKGDKAILGMQEFNILYPTARGYVSDWIGHKLQERNDLIAMRLDYVNVTLNGNDLGLYCLEENYDKILVENNKLKEGIIFKWGTTPDLYNSKDIDKNPVLGESSVVLRRLVKSFNIGDIGIEEVFDLPKMAKFFAINDLLNGYHHGISLSNTRYYFNPLTNLVEPIAREWLITTNKYKGGQEEMALAIEYLKDAPFFNRFFYNNEFMALYSRELERVSDPKFLDDFFRDVEPEMEDLLNIIYQDNPFYSYPKEFLYEYQAYIRDKIYPEQPIAAYFANLEGEKLKIYLRNLDCLPINIDHVVYDNEVILPTTSSTILTGINDVYSEYEIHQVRKVSAHENLEIPLPPDLIFDDLSKRLSIQYSVVGIDSNYVEDIFPWPYEERFELANELQNISDISKYDFLTINESTKSIQLDQGNITVSENIILPPGYTIYMYENTKLDIVNEGSIISYSPVQFIGSKEDPIFITSSDSTGQGIYVLNAESISSLEFVNFSSLSNPLRHGWTLPGAVTFYKSDISLDNCTFSNNKRGDDYLNIVDSWFRMNNCTFANVNSDAFDCDFCEGKIYESSFNTTGNDGLDISGSRISIYGVFMRGVGDKALSAGEGSILEAEDVEILDSEIAVSSKDLSKIILRRAIISNNKVGMNAFQKKPEFGPGSIEGTEVTITQANLEYLIEKNSDCTINGKVITPTSEDVEAILYGVEYGKSSK